MITASPKINYRDADQAYRDGRDALAAIRAMLAKTDAETSHIHKPRRTRPGQRLVADSQY